MEPSSPWSGGLPGSWYSPYMAGIHSVAVHVGKTNLHGNCNLRRIHDALARTSPIHGCLVPRLLVPVAAPVAKWQRIKFSSAWARCRGLSGDSPEFDETDLDACYQKGAARGRTLRKPCPSTDRPCRALCVYCFYQRSNGVGSRYALDYFRPDHRSQRYP